MKNTLQTLVFAFFCFVCAPSTAQTGTWRNYLAYSEPQQIAAASGNDIFVLASNGLYQYNTADGLITTYDKVNGMNGIGITNIAWNRAAKRLIAAYSDSNIDLVDTDGNITNISDLYSKTTTDDKTINSIYINDRYAYLGTNFGIVKVDMQYANISETYNLQMPISDVAVSGSNIFARTTSGMVLTAPTGKNLQDPANWQPTTDFPAAIFDRDLTDWNKYIDVVNTLRPGGPKYNYLGFLRFAGHTLFSVDKSPSSANMACIQTLNVENKEWTNYENDLKAKTGHEFVRLYCIDVDPKDESHVFAAGRTGLYEYRNGLFIKEYNNDNSPLQTASTVGNNNKDYVLVTGLKYDGQGNLWCTNSTSPNTSLFEIKDNSQWVSHHHKELMINSNCSFEGMEHLMFDSRGYLWFVNNYWHTPSLIRYNTLTDEIKVYSKITNQDGIAYDINYVTCVAEDKYGNIWIGTNIGPFMLEAKGIDSNSEIFTQVKIPRNDNTNYADYLLSGVYINAIAIDGGGRKWFGTDNNGVYLISDDNLTQIHHFQTNNSPLLSDNITDVAINDNTGEVFIGTNAGLCSYISDATISYDNMTKDNVYAYPNPVTPDYTGLITIVGLSDKAYIKIVTSSGTVVNEGQSNGGSYTWNGCDAQGNRIASGVYHVLTADSRGSKGTVCRIAIIK